MASPSMLAHITTAKFVDGLPLTRQSKQLARLGLDLGAGTMGAWMNTIGGEKVVPLIHLMNEVMLTEPFIHCDETPLQVLKSEKAPSSEHYMWVRAAGPPGRRIILFNYAPTRNTDALMQLLTGPDGPYRGKLVSDGLKIYDGLAEAWGLLLFGCLAHCRRYRALPALLRAGGEGGRVALRAHARARGDQGPHRRALSRRARDQDRKSTRLNSSHLG